MSNFTNSSLATLRRIRNSNRNAPRNQPITKITWHHAAGVMSSQNLLNWGHDPRCTGSWQYGVGNDGIIHQLINEADRAWTSSSPWNDNRAVTIEVANSTGAPNWEIGQRAWDAAIELTVDIIRRNPGITRGDGRPGLWFDGTQNGSLTFHDMFTNTACPGPFIRNRAQQICDEVNAKLDGLVGNSATVTPPTPTPENPIHVVRAGETLGVIARQHNTTVNELVRLNPISNPNIIRIGQLIKLPAANNVVNTSNVSNPYSNIRVGSQVRVNADARTWATGQTIPNWVRSNTYTVKQMRARNGRNEALLQGIVSWAWVDDLTII